MTQEELNHRIRMGESFLLAQDGQYLGRLTQNRYYADSILNQYGLYGSKYATNSIWNPYSRYGSQYSSYSPFNPYTSTPPYLFLRGVQVGVLSVNSILLNKLHPDKLLEWMKQNNL